PMRGALRLICAVVPADVFVLLVDVDVTAMLYVSLQLLQCPHRRAAKLAPFIAHRPPVFATIALSTERLNIANIVATTLDDRYDMILCKRSLSATRGATPIKKRTCQSPFVCGMRSSVHFK